MCFWLMMCVVDMKINVLKGEKYEVDPEDIKVSFNDVKGVSNRLEKK